MKKYMLKGIIVTVSVLFICAQQASAYTLNVPKGAVSIDEQTFSILEGTTQTSCDPTTEGYEGSCSTVAKQFNGSIVMNNKTGALYRFNFVGDIGLWDGILERYLPDGFYKTKDTYFWVANGQKLSLNKGKSNAYTRLLRRAKEDIPSITPISKVAFSELYDECSYQEKKCMGDLAYPEIHKFIGKILINVDSHGKMYMVDAYGEQIFPMTTLKNFTQTIHQLAIPIRKKVIQPVPDYIFQ